MLRTLSVIISLAVVVSCSSGEQRPSRTTWGPMWRDLEQQVPEPETILAADDPATTCDEGLAAVRDARGGELEPTPTAGLDRAYEAWTRAAETYLFDCPTEDEAMLADLARAADEAADEVDRRLSP